jgi:tetratricopeptide (TPR) repeat protein
VQLGASRSPQARRATADAAAYELYLKGQYDWRAHPGRGTAESVRYFQQAVAHDPAYAAAYAGLADAYIRLVIFGDAPPRETFAKAKAASLRALALDSTLAAAHASLGQIHMVSEYAWSDADREYQRAMALDPTYLFARELYSISLASRGHFAEAMAQLDTVRTIDPLELLNAHYPGRLLLVAGRPDDAIHLLRQLVEVDPQASQGYQQLGHAYLSKGMTREAITALRKAAALSGPRDSAQLAYAYAVSGQRAKARQVLRTLLSPSRRGPTSPYSIAMAYVGLGDRDAAFRWLDRGYAQRAAYMHWVAAEPAFASLHADTRWPAFLRRMGLQP